MEQPIDNSEIRETDRPSRKNLIIRNGAVFACVLIIIMLITHIFRDKISDQTQRIAWGEYLMLLAAIVVTQLDARTKIYDGKMVFGQAFSTGMLFVVFVTAVFSVFTLLFYLFVAPEVLGEMVVIAENTLREKGLTEDQIDMQMKFSERIFTPVGMFVMVIVGYLFVGTIMSLIGSLFTQRNR